MPAKILRRILRDKIEALLPEHALTIAKVAEKAERQSLGLMVDMLNWKDDDHGEV